MHKGGSMGGLSVETIPKDRICQNSATEFQQGFHHYLTNCIVFQSHGKTNTFVILFKVHQILIPPFMT